MHGRNYGDLPLWDILFGTFHNPERFEARYGFGDDQEARLPEMLRGHLIAEIQPIPSAAEGIQ